MNGVMRTRLLLGLAVAAMASIAAAQQLYRWTDENGRTHITDTPPPATAKGVRKVKPAAEPAAALPLVLQQAMKDFPVTLYTSPDCAEPCGVARDHLNKRGVPFAEVQIRDGVDELKRVAGVSEVPALKVGGKVLSGFERGAYDGLLDSAGYPRAGALAPRVQGAPPADEREAARRDEPVRPSAPPTGPYAPGAAPQRARK
jgi:glutaredoxin